MAGSKFLRQARYRVSSLLAVASLVAVHAGLTGCAASDVARAHPSSTRIDTPVVAVNTTETGLAGKATPQETSTPSASLAIPSPLAASLAAPTPIPTSTSSQAPRTATAVPLPAAGTPMASITGVLTRVPPSPPAPTSVPTLAMATMTSTSEVVPASSASTRLLKQDTALVPFDGAQDVTRSGNTVELTRRAGGEYASSGVLLAAPHAAEFPFDNVVMSWNAEAPAGTRLEFQVRVGSGDEVSPWFTMGTWSANGGTSVKGQSNAWGSVDVDTLELAEKQTTLQYRVTFATSNPLSSPRLHSVAVVYADLSVPLHGPSPTLVEGWARDLAVPQYSQLEQDPKVAQEICSPTSLTMVLNYWGRAKSVAEVYKGVWDAETGIFGNWPLNTAYAGALGFDAYVNRLYSLEQLQNEIAQGRPVVISIRFGPGQLDNAPIAASTGHLLVVRGFTPQGDVIVNDPIAPSSSAVRRVYKRDQIAKVWLDSGGIAYILRPQ